MINEFLIADDFYYAYKTENLMLWGKCCELWDAKIRKGELSKYVNNLRKSFWHNGTDEDIKKCRKAANQLKVCLSFLER